MKANQATLPIATMARLLQISASGYYGLCRDNGAMTSKRRFA
ncbi:hypothetical protein [Paraburkholderia sp. NMBU_R16]|nr:hypothetical protein [Paraburkholderia sp. NMBU_R16]